jgi:hypothetical protein
MSFGIAMAHAAPRDEMLAGISRCKSIIDEKTFLNCVYGAAQPVRAELGLPAAPVAQQNLVPVDEPTPPNPPRKGFFAWLWPF